MTVSMKNGSISSCDWKKSSCFSDSREHIRYCRNQECFFERFSNLHQIIRPIYLHKQLHMVTLGSVRTYQCCQILRNLYINTLREKLFSPLRSQIIVVFYDRLHVHCTSPPSSISSISQHFSSPTDESEDFLFENGNRRRSKCIGDQSARSSSRG